MTIHEMYGQLAEQQAVTEANRKFLHELVLNLLSGKVALAEVEQLDGGGFKVNRPPEEDPDIEEAPRED